MNGLKIGMLVVSIALVISIGFLAVLGMENISMKDELATARNDVLEAGVNLETAQSQLQEKTNELLNSNTFILKFLAADGRSYSASDAWTGANTKYDLAGVSYEDSVTPWSTVETQYHDCLGEYTLSGQKFRNAAAAYYDAKNYTQDTTYQSLCDASYNMMTSGSELAYYMYEAAEYMESACSYYDNDDYATGDDRVDKANVRITLHDEEIVNYNNYLTEIQNILMGLY